MACDVTDAANDKQQAAPIAQATLANLAQAGIERPKDETGTTQAIPATLDNGYYSAAAVEALGDCPRISTGSSLNPRLTCRAHTQMGRCP